MSRLSQPPMSLVEWERFNRELQELTRAVWRRLPADEQFGEWAQAQQAAMAAFKRLRPRPLHAVPSAERIPEWGWQGT